MVVKIKKRQKKIGLPPGTLITPEDIQREPSNISVIDYTEKEFHARQVTSPVDLFVYKTTPTISWISVDNANNSETLEAIGAGFGLHPLVLEDIQTSDHRPKIEDYDEYLYIVIRLLFPAPEGEVGVVSEQLSLVVGTNYVITFSERDSGALNTIRERIRSAKGRIRKMGADYLAYCLMDSIVDNYFTVLEKMDERIEDVEEQLMDIPTPETLQNITELKREAIALRKSIWPMREVISAMQRTDSDIMTDATKVYLRDIYDNTVHVVDTVESFRDILSGMLDIYLSSNSNRLNEVIKFLTVISTIFIPLTFLAGVYGMNFKHFPELDWYYGYHIFWMIIVVVALVMLVYFRKKEWI